MRTQNHMFLVGKNHYQLTKLLNQIIDIKITNKIGGNTQLLTLSSDEVICGKDEMAYIEKSTSIFKV